MTKTVEAWAVIKRDGDIRGIWQPFVAWTKETADDLACRMTDQVVKVTITYRLGDGDEG